MIGDVIAEWLAFAAPVVAVWLGWQTLFQEKIFAVWVLDFILAFAIGIVFQYFAIVPMRNLSPGKGIAAALKADTLSLAARTELGVASCAASPPRAMPPGHRGGCPEP